MKKILLTVFVALGVALAASAQAFFEAVTFTGAFAPYGTSYTAKIDGGFTETFSNGDWTSDWTNWYPKKTVYSSNFTETLSGDVSSDRSISGVVKLEGTVHVKNGATLTIAAGTIIRAGLGATLIISKGSKIKAVGTRNSPIVFTSIKDVDARAPGDWAGILLIGNSQVNTSSGKRQYEALPNDPLAEYGGGRGNDLNVNDNSGEMRFVRIEFAGYNYLPDQELNGLTLGAVGAGTRVNFVQVSYARDDSFEWFGGTSRHKYLVAFAGVDDDFDMDEGFAGRVQFILGVRNPSVFETAAGGTSNGFEHDNNTGLGSASAVVPGNNDPTPNTAPLISHATMIGPWATRASTPGNKFGRAMEMRSAVATSVYNSVVIGYATLASLVHPATNITPSTAYRLQNQLNGNDNAGGAITRAEYVNTHLISTSGMAFTYAAASNQPAPTLNFATYMNGTNGNSSFQATTASIFESPISDFNNVNTVSYAPKAVITSVAASYPGLIADKTFPSDGFASIPSGSVSKSALNFGTKQVGESFTAATFNLEFANLTGTGVTVSSSSNDFSVVLSQVTSVGGIATVNYLKTVAGVSNASITVNFGDNRVANIVVPVVARLVVPAAPILVVDAPSLSFVANELVTSASYTSLNQLVQVTGKNLSDNVTVTSSVGYEVSVLPTEGFGSSLVLTRNADKTLVANVYVRLNTTNVSSSNAGTLDLISGSASASIALSANTNTTLRATNNNATSAAAVTIDYFTGQAISIPSGNFSVNGDRLPSSVTITSLSPDIQIALGSANGTYSSSVVLTTTGQITSTASNVWVKYFGSLTSSGAAQQVGTISVTGVGNVIPVSIRANAPSSVIQRNYILTDASSRIITAIGFNFNSVLRSTPWLYRANDNALIGAIATNGLGTSTATLTGNAGITTNTVYTPITFAGVVDSDVSSAEITITGGTLTDAIYPAGLPLHLTDGTLIGYVSTVTSASTIMLQANAGVTTSASIIRTSAIYYKRNIPTISVSPGAPLALSITSYTNGLPNPVVGTLAITGDHHDLPVNIGINPALTASGLMFEISLGNNPASVTGTFALTITPSGTGQINQTITVRYVPTNITLYNLPALDINAAHSTELLILGGNGALANANSSSRPRSEIAYNLQGRAFATLASNKASLAKFTTYRGLPSVSQKFNLSGSRIVNDITLTAPANYKLSTTTDFSNATNVLVISSAIAGLNPSIDINVQYSRADVGSNDGSISIATPGIAPVVVNVSGETIGFSSIVNLSASEGSVISFTGITQVTVSGTYLTADLTVTASNGFLVSETLDGTYSSSLSFQPSPADFGDIAPKTVFVKNIVTLLGTGFAGTLTAESGDASSVINLKDNSVGTGTVDPTVAISSIVVYPNPTAGDATLAIELAGTEKISVTIFEVTGSVASSFSATASGLSTFPISGLSKGIYIIKVATNSSVKTLKLVVE